LATDKDAEARGSLENYIAVSLRQMVEEIDPEAKQIGERERDKTK